MTTTATGNSSKLDLKNNKMKQKKTNLALVAAASIGVLAVLGYTVWSYRATLARGGAAAAKTLGPIISRLLPAIVVGVLSMVVGPEGAILGVPLGAIFGPELLGALGGLIGDGNAAAIGAGAMQVAAARAAASVPAAASVVPAAT
jgi:hypothetical protein